MTMKINNFILFCCEWSNWNGFVLHLLHYDGDFFNKPLDNSFFSINFSENYLYIDLFFMSFKIYDRIR